VRAITSPVQGATLNRMAPRATGFDATGYTVARLPRDRNSATVSYAVTYEKDGMPMQLTVTSDMVLETYNGLVGKARTQQFGPVGTDSIIAPSGLIE